MDWKLEAERLYKLYGREWSLIADEMAAFFPDDNHHDAKEKIRSHIRCSPLWKQAKADDFQEGKRKYESDGTILSTKFLTLQLGDVMTPDEILEAHGFDPDKWEVASCTDNFWNSQIKGGAKQISFQSKLSARPKSYGISFEDMDAYFATKKFKYDKPLTKAINYDPNGEILEIDLPDLHGGLLAWCKETGADYDVHIAVDYFYKCFYDIVARCKGKRIKKILLATLGDLLHTDNDNQTTTKGTFQQADGRLTKIFNAVLDMLIDAITILGDIAPVEVIYLPGNHDRTTGCFLIKAVEMAFRHDDNVTFDIDPNPQKFKLIGNVLLGWTHGDMPIKNMTSWLQQAARKEYGMSKFAEIHAGHFHSEKTLEVKKDMTQTEDAGGIVIRYLPTICNASYWEHQQGYNSAVKAMMAFVWNEETGLRESWQSNIA